jgi:hypothetical protein
MHSTIGSIALASLLIAGPVQAQVFDLRDFHESLDGTLAQVPGNLWNYRYGDADGGLLPLLSPGVYGYACGTCTQIGQLVNTGDSAWNGTFGYGSAVTPTFDGVFLHPGPSAASSVAIVFTAQTDVWLTGVTIDAEMVLNGLAGDGVDITVSHTRDGITTALGGHGASGAAFSQVAYAFGASALHFAAGDRVTIDVGPAGGYTYDHLNIDVRTTAVAAPVPEPGSAALLLAGAGLLGAIVRRRGGRSRRVAIR